MASANSFNLRSPAVKRLLQEARELQKDQSSDYAAHPLEDNLFEWHFVLRGPESTEFEGGRYHGRILFPSEYPFKPPNLMLMTPNGRFELNKKICLSITGYHPEYWLPAWGVRTVLLGLIGFMTTKANGAIGGIDYTEVERKVLAVKSRKWKCPTCGITNIDSLPNEKPSSGRKTSTSQNKKNKVRNEDPSIPTFSFVYDDEINKGKSENTASSDSKDNLQSTSQPIVVTSAGSSNSSINPIQDPNQMDNKSVKSTRNLVVPLRTPKTQPPISRYLLDALIITLLGILLGILGKKFT
ncbi:hypothetical protein G9A89_021838 [Geosiphon pyriformis]|nr:hypothetical protein G9A89_021838 [Geosiphon pyriformis]